MWYRREATCRRCFCNDLFIIVAAGENVVQEGSNMKAVLL